MIYRQVYPSDSASCQRHICIYVLHGRWILYGRRYSRHLTRTTKNGKYNTTLCRALRYRGYSVLKILLATFVVLCVYTYAFKEEIKDTVADVTADITSRSLGDVEVMRNAETLSKSVVHQVWGICVYLYI